MVQGINSSPTASQLYTSNQTAAQNGQYQNISGPNDVADKTTALVLNTTGQLSQGLVNAFNQSTAGLDQNLQNAAGGTGGNATGGAANTGSQYNQSGQPTPTIGSNQSGNLLSKIV